MIETTIRDLRIAGRGLRRHPGFTGVAIVTLALGIRATTAVFSVVYGVLLCPLPFPNADRLVQIIQLLERPAASPRRDPSRAGLTAPATLTGRGHLGTADRRGHRSLLLRRAGCQAPAWPDTGGCERRSFPSVVADEARHLATPDGIVVAGPSAKHSVAPRLFVISVASWLAVSSASPWRPVSATSVAERR